MRLDDNYKQNENELNIGRNREMRQNPEYRDNENEKNMERNRQMRLDDNYKQNENELNIGRNKEMRQIPEYRDNENENNMERNRQMRLDDNYKQNENELNIGRNREMRQNPEYRDNENENNMERNRQMRLDDNYKQNENELNIDKIPKITETENLKFPNIPDYISNLTPIEERMVSPYIPFMQIKALQPYALNSQLSLLGSIVNIATDVNEMVSELPRKFNELSVVQIKLKRHVEHQSNYMYETIKPSNVCKALKFLKDTPLYKENNIEISTDFFTHYEENNVNMNFIVEEQDLQKSQNTTGENIVKKINEFKRNENELVDTYELNDEVLLIDNNEFSSNTHNSIVIAPGQNKQPLPWHKLKNYDELCFPKIFGGYHFDKQNILTYSERVLSEIRRKDRRSCVPTRLLFMAKQKLEKSVYSNMNICLRKIYKNDNLKAENVLNTKTLHDMYRLDEGYKFLKQVRSSPSYWQEKKKHLFSMIKQLGFPTLFITLSASETKNFDLLKILYNLKFGKNLTKQELIDLHPNIKTQLIRDDPVTCVRYLNERFSQIIKLLTNKNGIFGQYYVTDYFVRCEFQQRGSVHQHAVLYCNNVPQYDETNIESELKLLQFIDSFITCEYDPKNPYMMFQRHKHTHSCYKGKKKTKKCRFDYPKYVMRKTCILKPLNDEELTGNENIHIIKIKDMMLKFFNENIMMNYDDILHNLEITENEYIQAIRSTLKNKKLFYKRTSLEVAINPYNPTILKLLGSNMDLQGILDAYAAAFYMVNYVTKIDSGLSKLLKEASEDIVDGNTNIQQRFSKIANIFINGSVMSTQEAAYHTLSLPLCYSSRSSIYINTAPKNDRTRILKNKKDLQKLPPNSKNIYKSNIFEKYEKRKNCLEDMCLSDFACKFSDINKLIKKDEDTFDDNDNLISRHKDKILRCHNYKLDIDPTNYYRENLLLFFPFRNENVEIENQNYKQLFTKNINIIIKNKTKFYKIDETEIQNALQNIELQENEDEINPTSNHENIDILQQIGNEKTNKKIYKLLFPKIITKKEIFDQMNVLNNKQKEIIMHILHCFKTQKLPLRIFINGSAGVGKSTVINTLFQLLTIQFNEIPGENTENNKILLCAPSGKAAYLIGGVTCHHAFALPINQCGQPMKALSEDIASTIRCNFQFIKLIIIDEISMVGSNMFYEIDTRLRQIFGINKSFGGISIITVGDLHQLPPVLDKPIYKHSSNSSLAMLSPYTLWDEFNMFTLTQIMRQQNDIPFINVLNNIAKGTTNENDCKLINTRTTLETNIPTDAIRLYSQNKFVDKYNTKKIMNTPGKLTISVCDDKIIDQIPELQKQKLLSNMKTKKRQECGGLHYQLQLKLGIKYMITTNINVEDGLVNGAYGTLKWIDYDNIVPKTLWIDFGKNKKIGMKAKNAYKLPYPNISEKNLIPIQKTHIINNLKTGIQITRCQFPLTPAEAITIHKSQGETYDKVCLDVTKLNNKFTTNSLLYVAFSRTDVYGQNGSSRVALKSHTDAYGQNGSSRITLNSYTDVYGQNGSSRVALKSHTDVYGQNVSSRVSFNFSTDVYGQNESSRVALKSYTDVYGQNGSSRVALKSHTDVYGQSGSSRVSFNFSTDVYGQNESSRVALKSYTDVYGQNGSSRVAFKSHTDAYGQNGSSRVCFNFSTDVYGQNESSRVALKSYTDVYGQNGSSRVALKSHTDAYGQNGSSRIALNSYTDVYGQNGSSRVALKSHTDVYGQNGSSRVSFNFSTDVYGQNGSSRVSFNFSTDVYGQNGSSRVALKSHTDVYGQNVSSRVSFNFSTDVYGQNGSSRVALKSHTDVYGQNVSSRVALKSHTDAYGQSGSSRIALNSYTDVYGQNGSSRVNLKSHTDVYGQNVSSRVSFNFSTDVYGQNGSSRVALKSHTDVYGQNVSSRVALKSHTDVYGQNESSRVALKSYTDVYGQNGSSRVALKSHTDVYGQSGSSRVALNSYTDAYGQNGTSRVALKSHTDVYGQNVSSRVSFNFSTDVYGQNGSSRVALKSHTDVYGQNVSSRVALKSHTDVYGQNESSRVALKSYTDVYGQNGSSRVALKSHTDVYGQSGSSRVALNSYTDVYGQNGSSRVALKSYTDVYGQNGSSRVAFKSHTDAYGQNGSSRVCFNFSTDVYGQNESSRVALKSYTDVYGQNGSSRVALKSHTDVYGQSGSSRVALNSYTDAYGQNGTSRVALKSHTDVYGQNVSSRVSFNFSTDVYGQNGSSRVALKSHTDAYGQNGSSRIALNSYTDVYGQNGSSRVALKSHTDVYGQNSHTDAYGQSGSSRVALNSYTDVYGQNGSSRVAFKSHTDAYGQNGSSRVCFNFSTDVYGQNGSSRVALKSYTDVYGQNGSSRVALKSHTDVYGQSGSSRVALNSYTDAYGQNGSSRVCFNFSTDVYGQNESSRVVLKSHTDVYGQNVSSRVSSNFSTDVYGQNESSRVALKSHTDAYGQNGSSRVALKSHTDVYKKQVPILYSYFHTQPMLICNEFFFGEIL
ncbi:hypothetical protein TKK_0000133 [Trichogramma kaykai]|uniref:ATP-dependent DNA helicase n=1 Tax=Trichogramma kaykai TaxID=54128 RepID=A0ABD2W356_9HYME